MNRRQLLASFLAAPVAVRFTPVVAPMPDPSAAYVASVIAAIEANWQVIADQWIDAMILASTAPSFGDCFTADPPA